MKKADKDFFSLKGSIQPTKRPEDFKAMRKAFIEYLGARKMKKESFDRAES